MKKRIAKVITILIICCLLCGCGSSSKQTTTESTTEEAPVESITYEGAKFTFPDSWSPSIEDGKLYAYPNENRYVYVFFDETPKASDSVDIAEYMEEVKNSLDNVDFSGIKTGTTRQGYACGTLTGGEKEANDQKGMYNVYVDLIVTEKGSFLCCLMDFWDNNTTEGNYGDYLETVNTMVLD